MDPLDEQLAKLKLINSYPLSPRVYSESNVFKNPTTTEKLCANEVSPKKIGPAVPPKPSKKSPNFPEVPQSMVVRQTCEPLYSKRLQSDSVVKDGTNKISAPGKPMTTAGPAASILHRKQPNYAAHHIYSNNKVTLDNPAILDQQLEALEHHKKQLEKKGLLQNNTAPKLSSASFLSGSGSNNTGDVVVSKNSASNSYLYSNIRPNLTSTSTATLPLQNFDRRRSNEPTGVYSNINHKQQQFASGDNITSGEFIYSNVHYGNNANELPPPPPLELSTTSNMCDSADYLNQCPAIDDDIPPPPSPVSSSYSELRRATDAYPKLPSYPILTYGKNGGVKSVDGMGNNSSSSPTMQPTGMLGCPSIEQQQTYINMSYHNDYSAYGSPSLQQSFSQSSSDCYGYGSSSQGSSTYESIYEPINPRPPSQLSSRSNYLPYTPYVNSPQFSEGETTNSSVIGGSKPANVGMNLGSGGNGKLQSHKETEVEVLTDLLVHSMDASSDVDSFGICVACNDRVVGENSGCTAMDQVYHISCFTCSQCQINLQGKPFYALDGKPYCEVDYLNTLEKCSVCMKPILERILRATGKPYHPQCFTCVVCGNSLDGIPFTVDATNQNYCIADFHKKFAPRCCVCKLPIMPEPGQEETVRVVALDRSFHFECYKCEDCGLLLSSEAEGRGCYPLDDHVLCKSCNAKRVQMLTNRMTTEL